MARPKKEIDRSSFEGLCGLQCTKEEICSFLNVTDKTLDRWCKETYHKGFSDIFREKRKIGKISLRRSQWRLAEKNVTMAIFLGKQYLGQREVTEVAATATGKLADLIEGLKEPADYDLYTETTGGDGVMENE